jgi:4-amino-4-deoxy-L-arabinose transferase-like glycosyltransferase
VSRRTAYTIVAAIAAVPRLAVVLHEGDSIAANAEKSLILATNFAHGRGFGFLPGQPSADTQPLYGWFLIPFEWIFNGHWLAIGLAQIVVAIVTALLVYEIGRRFLSQRWAIGAAAISTLQPYLIWHDVHFNREILDQLCAAVLVLLTLLVAERPRAWLALLLGIDTGLALLGNTRLVFVPLLVAVYLLARRAPVLPVALVLVGAAVAVTPWLVRNKVEVGCWAITTDGRAFWKANNPQTYHLLSTHQWIDNVSRDSPRPPHPGYLTPDEARGILLNKHKLLHPDECLEMTFYENLAFDYLRDHPGAKLKLAALSEDLYWSPQVIETSNGSGGAARTIVQPTWMWALYAFAAVGLFFVPRTFLALAIALFAYQSFWAALFVGATRYRINFDFLLALLAAAGLSWLWGRRRRADR